MLICQHTLDDLRDALFGSNVDARVALDAIDPWVFIEILVEGDLEAVQGSSIRHQKVYKAEKLRTWKTELPPWRAVITLLARKNFQILLIFSPYFSEHLSPFLSQFSYHL